MSEHGSSERFSRLPLRYRRLGDGYRKEDVEYALAELRLNLRQLDSDVESLRTRNRELEDELRTARAGLEAARTKELELTQTMTGILRRANEIEESAQERARTILEAAEEAAQRLRLDADRHVQETSGQLDEIRRLRENLVASMKRVAGELGEALARIERGESLLAPSEPAAPVAAPQFEPWPEPAHPPYEDAAMRGSAADPGLVVDAL